jgi:hypothetical protein
MGIIPLLEVDPVSAEDESNVERVGLAATSC